MSENEARRIKQVWTGYLGGALSLFRAKVPGGWLVIMYYQRGDGMSSMTFYPDPQHEWDGSLLPQEDEEVEALPEQEEEKEHLTNAEIIRKLK